MNYSDLSPEERAEIDALVHDAYQAPDGSTRTHVEAQSEFDKSVESAVQAHRDWAGVLLDSWRERGMKTFMQERWKHLRGTFELKHRGRSRQRTVNRGARRPDSEGRLRYAQPPLWEWTAADLREAIADAARQVAEHQANIALYRDMLALLEQTGALRFSDALDGVGKTWDQFLEERAA